MSYFEILFYFFAGLIVLSAIMVVLSENPVHSVFYLILVFALTSLTIMLLGVEFLAMIFIIVYVGAIAVLFLFVVMMLNIRIVELNESMLRYLPVGGAIGLVLLMQLYYILKQEIETGERGTDWVNWLTSLNSLANMQLLGEVLYTYYFYMFLLAGVILLVSMIGTIVLTLHHEVNVRRQEVYKQVGRDFMWTVVKKEKIA